MLDCSGSQTLSCSFKAKFTLREFHWLHHSVSTARLAPTYLCCLWILGQITCGLG
jgi:hypothetical protein